MIPGGALIRLAAWYLVLIALILACFNVIVYFTLSQTLQARVAADLEAKSRLVMASLILGALVAFLMALKSLRPIQRNLKKQREFVADASHELRTPLTLIRTNAEAWLRRAAGTPQATYAQHILEEVDQLNAIVGDLTTLALADARQLRIERRPVELSGIVRELIDH